MFWGRVCCRAYSVIDMPLVAGGAGREGDAILAEGVEPKRGSYFSANISSVGLCSTSLRRFPSLKVDVFCQITFDWNDRGWETKLRFQGSWCEIKRNFNSIVAFLSKMLQYKVVENRMAPLRKFIAHNTESEFYHKGSNTGYRDE